MPRPKSTDGGEERKEKARKQKKAPAKFKYSPVLSDKEIRRAVRRGHIRIEPYNRNQVKPNSYDVRLGKWFYRQRDDGSLLNMYAPGAQLWGERVEKAMKLKEYIPRHHRDMVTLNGTYEPRLHLEFQKEHFQGISPNDRVFVLQPGETVLGHTEEFIGGVDGVTTMIKTRSSLGRNNIGICKCAGWGDTGFTNRWTLEITNFSTHRPVVLVCGRRMGQIVFMSTGEVSAKYSGKYQSGAEWRPEDMLPRLDQDEA